jgi:hypothetical protein
MSKLTTVSGTQSSLSGIMSNTVSTSSTVNITTASPYYVSVSGSGTTFIPPKTKYVLLSKEVEISGYHDTNIAIVISLINTIGIKYYIDLKNQGFSFGNELDEILNKEIIIRNRNEKIKTITNDIT